MKNIMLFSLIAAIAFCTGGCKTASHQASTGINMDPLSANMPTVVATQHDQNYVKGSLIIFYDSEVGSAPLMQAIKDYGASLIYEYKTMSGVAISIPDGKDIQQAISYFGKVKGVVTVGRDRILHLDEAKPQ